MIKTTSFETVFIIRGFMEDKETPQRGSNANYVAKAGTWYTICNFMFRGMAFITTPIFTRLMSKGELGSFNNFSSWISILTVLTSFDLAQSVIRSKLEHEHDMDRYISSLMVLTNIVTIIAYTIVCIFSDFFVGLFQIEMKYIHIMFIYLFFAPAYQMLITKHRAFYKYKMFVLLTGIMTISGLLLSLLMVIIMSDKLAGRIIGYYAPYIIISLFIYVYIMAKGKGVKIEYWRYSCKICLPLVPHVLSLYLLSSSDKIIITKICGAEYTAIYGVAYSCYHIVTILFDSMNKAWAPWLLENLHHQNYKAIYSASKKYIVVFETLVLGCLMIVPEIIYVLGGKSYLSAIYCLPPLITSCVFQFIYTMYVNIEFYQKKTIPVAVATMIATAINIFLNILFIPLNVEHGYVIAAYTTLVGYIVLFVLHYFTVKTMKLAFIYDIRLILVVLGFTLAISFAMNFLYKFLLPRYLIILIYGCCILYYGYQNKEMLLGIFKKAKT